MVRIAIIGTGFGQQVQIPGFRAVEGAEVVAICSGHPERAEAAARAFDIPYAFSDYRAMLERVPLDLVSIATPVYLHRPMTLAALAPWGTGVAVVLETAAPDEAGASRVPDALKKIGVPVSRVRVVARTGASVDVSEDVAALASTSQGKGP